ncbi:hypothetical protein [Flavobacterium sp.]|uniref:hypothetical protein n=1 Tax=Flavobacterium sp. TaxID=239 RepID=UPI002633A3DA|nr:hypothetical protein [Flavobacterium sp.]
MENHSKEFLNYDEFKNASEAFRVYQLTHNIIRKDYQILLEITERAKDNNIEFDALYRASLKSLFTIIEADIFGLNNLDKYPNYSDQHRFEDKFKNTFSNICKVWKKQEIKEKYFDAKYSDLKNIRRKRDELVHPKNMLHIHGASINDFNKLKQVFTDYDNFINSLMDGFFIEVQIDIKDILGIKNG